jgi:hypothetical protein
LVRIRRRPATVGITDKALTVIMTTAMTCRPWSLTPLWKVIERIADDAIDPR